jgi:hypothetical protein
MVQMLLINSDDNKSLMESVKQIDIKQVVYMSASAWDDITTTTVLNSSPTLLTNSGNQDQSTHEEQEVSFDSFVAQLDSDLAPENIDIWLGEDDIWLGEDANDPSYQLLTEDKIVKSVTEQAIDIDKEEEE